jgi:hypothetical protein
LVINWKTRPKLRATRLARIANHPWVSDSCITGKSTGCCLSLDRKESTRDIGTTNVDFCERIWTRPHFLSVLRRRAVTCLMHQKDQRCPCVGSLLAWWMWRGELVSYMLRAAGCLFY